MENVPTPSAEDVEKMDKMSEKSGSVKDEDTTNKPVKIGDAAEEDDKGVELLHQIDHIAGHSADANNVHGFAQPLKVKKSQRITRMI